MRLALVCLSCTTASLGAVFTFFLFFHARSVHRSSLDCTLVGSLLLESSFLVSPHCPCSYSFLSLARPRPAPLLTKPPTFLRHSWTSESASMTGSCAENAISAARLAMALWFAAKIFCMSAGARTTAVHGEHSTAMQRHRSPASRHRCMPTIVNRDVIRLQLSCVFFFNPFGLETPLSCYSFTILFLVVFRVFSVDCWRANIQTHFVVIGHTSFT